MSSYTYSPDYAISTLTDLRIALVAGDARVVDANGDWTTDEPLISIGPRPLDTHGVWGWTQTEVLTGTCADDLMIEMRTDR